MAFEVFIDTVESKKMLKERDKYLVFGQHCTRKYDGEAKELGDQIRITGLGSPTVYQLKKDGTYTASQVFTGSKAGSGKEIIHKSLPAAEEVIGNSVTLKVEQMSVWNIFLGDLDKMLAEKAQEKISMLRTKVSKKLAFAQDQYIAKTIVNFADAQNSGTTAYKANGVYLTAKDAASDADGTSTKAFNILDFVDEQVQIFNERDYGDGVELFAECTPKFWRRLKKALRQIDTDNSKVVRGRECTEYNGIYFFKTNNAVVDNVEYFILRTGDAVAFFDPVTHSEKYRVENGFGDGWKGFNLYDAGIVEPKAMLWSKISGYAD